MTEIERKALELVNEVQEDENYIVPSLLFSRGKDAFCEALCRAIEQHEAFRQEVSDAVEVANMRAKELKRNTSYIVNHMQYFIITKPDPLVEVLSEAGYTYLEADKLRAALAKRGLEIREKSDD